MENEFKDIKAISEIYAKDAKESNDALEAKKQMIQDLNEKIKRMERTEHFQPRLIKAQDDSKDEKEDIFKHLKTRTFLLRKEQEEQNPKNRFQALLKDIPPIYPSKAQDNSKYIFNDVSVSKDNSKNETKSFEMNAAFMELSVDETTKIASFHDELDPLAITQIIDDVQDAKNESSFFGDENQTVIENVNEKAK